MIRINGFLIVRIRGSSQKFKRPNQTNGIIIKGASLNKKYKNIGPRTAPKTKIRICIKKPNLVFDSWYLGQIGVFLISENDNSARYVIARTGAVSTIHVNGERIINVAIW
jgi:hypothetical protein